MEDPRFREYEALWTERGWWLWRTPGGKLLPMNESGGADPKAFTDDEEFGAAVVERMRAAGVPVSEELPESRRPFFEGVERSGYQLWRSPDTSGVPAEWGEWPRWFVLGRAGTPIGFVWEERELLPGNTWGPPTYVVSHNPIEEGRGDPVWRAEGFATPEAALSALVARIEQS